MTLFKNKYRIESVRLKEYDYSRPGEYFVTVCTHNHESLFGIVKNDKMNLSFIGDIARKYWLDIPNHFQNVELDEFIIMPNHVHGIIILFDNNHGRDAINRVSTGGITTKTNNPMLSHESLSNIVRQYKSRVSYEIHKTYPDYTWQPRFYERIIRDERELNDIRDYIINNPIKWFEDKENPSKSK